MFSLFRQSFLAWFFAVFLWFLSHFDPFGIRAWAWDNFGRGNTLMWWGPIGLSFLFLLKKLYYFSLTVISKCRKWHRTYLKIFPGEAWPWTPLRALVGAAMPLHKLPFFTWQGSNLCKREVVKFENVCEGLSSYKEEALKTLWEQKELNKRCHKSSPTSSSPAKKKKETTLSSTFCREKRSFKFYQIEQTNRVKLTLSTSHLHFLPSIRTILKAFPKNFSHRNEAELIPGIREKIRGKKRERRGAHARNSETYISHLELKARKYATYIADSIKVRIRNSLQWFASLTTQQ